MEDPEKAKLKEKEKEKPCLTVGQGICGLISLVLVIMLIYGVTLMNTSYKAWYRYDKMDNREWDPFSNKAG